LEEIGGDGSKPGCDGQHPAYPAPANGLTHIASCDGAKDRSEDGPTTKSVDGS
jgi:hypothetical protein